MTRLYWGDMHATVGQLSSNLAHPRGHFGNDSENVIAFVPVFRPSNRSSLERSLVRHLGPTVFEPAMKLGLSHRCQLPVEDLFTRLLVVLKHFLLPPCVNLHQATRALWLVLETLCNGG